MAHVPAPRSLTDLLQESSATPAFKEAVLGLEQGRTSSLIEINPPAPAVKGLRVICKVLEMLPHEPIESVSIRAVSGCSNFTGSLRLQPGDVTIEFDWDCRWRAQQQGWSDPFGDPDQIRAARELGYQCFVDFRVARPGHAGEAMG